MINKVSNINFRQNDITVSNPTDKNPKKYAVKKSNAAIATAGISALFLSAYFIHRKFTKAAQILDFVSEFNSKVNKYNFNEYDFLNSLGGLNEFKYFVVAKKNNYQLNSISSNFVKFSDEASRDSYNIIKSLSKSTNKININGVNDNDAVCVTKLLTDAFHEKYIHLKFNGNNFVNLQKSLNEMDKNTYVYMENMKDFLDKGGVLPDKLFYYSKLHESPVNISLNKNLDFTSDYRKFNRLTDDVVQMAKSISRFVMLETDIPGFIKALNNGESAFFSIVNKDKNKYNIVKFLGKELKVPIYKVRNETFDGDLIKALDYKDTTGKPLLAYIENTLSEEQYNKLEKAKIGICGENLPYEKTCPIYTLPYSTLEDDVRDAVKKVNSKLQNIEIAYDKPNGIKMEILVPLSRNIYDETRPKGILFYGDIEKSNNLLKQIADITDIPVKTVNFDDYMSGLSQFIKYIKKADTSKNKVLIDLINIDKHLQEPDNIEAVKRIARFKNIMELSFENSYATAILRTDKDLDAFEQASIAPHRFNVQFQI